MKLKITVHGVAYEVDVELLDAGEGFPVPASSPLPRIHSKPSSPPAGPAAPRSATLASRPAPSPGGAVTSPIAGTILEILCKKGDWVEKDKPLLIIEAMKMETTIAAPAQGKIKSVDVAVGDSIREGQILVQFE